MNVGIYVTTTKPQSPSQARLQGALLSELARFSENKYKFIIFSNDEHPNLITGGIVRHHKVELDSRWTSAGKRLRAVAAETALSLLWWMGITGGRKRNNLVRWAKVEPRYYNQLRQLNVRILWNMNQHELKTSIPFIRTIWEVNHRIHPFFPEYSYARYGFDGLDAGMADSLARASYVITGTEVGKQQLVSMLGVHEAKIRVLPFPAPILKDVAGGVRMDLVGNYVLYPSRFWPHKNHVVILEALKILRDRHSLNLRCIFTGSDCGNLRYVLNYASNLGLGDLVDYRGEVSESELVALYRGALALIYASAVGPDNLPPLEAMILACPVITAEVPGAKEQYGEAALFFKPTDENDLAQQIIRLSKEPLLRKALVARGLSHAATLSTERYCKGVISILDEFARSARAWERCDSVFN